MTDAPPPPARSPGGAAALNLLVATMVVLAAANSVVFALLADLRARYGLPGWSLGVMSGTAFATGVVVQLFVAPLADRGHARKLLVLALLVAVVGNVLFALGSSLAPFLVARALAGVSFGCFGPAARALAAASGPPESTGRRLGRMAAADLGGFTIGPVVGSILGQHFGVRLPFVVFGVLSLAALLLLGPRPLPPLVQAGDTRPSLALARHRGVLVATLLAVGLFLPVGLYDALWAQYMKDRGASTTFVGISLAMYTLPFVLFATLGGRIADRFGARRCALVGVGLTAPFVLFYGLLTHPWAIAGVSVVEAMLAAVLVPAASAAMAHAAPVGKAASAQGLAGAAQQASAVLVGFSIAPLYRADRPWFVFGLAFALLLVVWIVTLTLARGDHGIERAVAPALAREPS